MQEREHGKPTRIDQQVPGIAESSTRQRHGKRVGRMLDRNRDHGFGMWAVVLRETGEMIGQCGLTMQHILEEDVVEVGYLFQRAHWHRGYAIEAAAACRDHAFDVLGVDRVYAQIRDTNLASMNVAIRLGMTVRGRFVKHYRGVDMPHLAFAVDRPDGQVVRA